ncbi:MAG TPA: alpha/beta hydrolase [Thermoanaerobaculia bacterium]|nr:alpha/beta hydrolase [Thermoanaerobaculia bacterium]
MLLSIAALAATGTAALVVAQRRNRAGQPKEPQGPLRSLWTEVDGVSIHARVSARPTSGVLPVVLIHGYGMSGRYMLPIARRIAAEYPAYVPDLPGHGRSGKPERTLSVPELAEALRAWMDAVGLRRAAFLANSMGTQVVADLAARHPERVERLVLVGPTLDPTHTLGQQMLRLVWTGAAERPSLIPLMIADYLRTRPGRLVKELRAMFRDRIEEKLPRIDAPAMVVRGERDAVIPQPWAEEVARLLGTDRFFVIPDAGHALNYSDADELMRLIRPFLREGERALRRG